MKLEFTCLNVSEPHYTGQTAFLKMPLPPPQPAADGQGNPVKHPRPASGALELFVTSDERRALLSKLYALEQKLKKMRYQASVGVPEAQDELVRLEHGRGELMKELDRLKDFRFEHGVKYVITVEKAK